MKKTATILTALLLGTSFVANSQTFIEDFESASVPSLPAGWSQNTAATTGWKVNTGAISFPQTGWTLPAHTKYAVVDDFNNNENNSVSTLVSKSIDLTQFTTPFLSFDYYFIGARRTANNKTEKFTVKISTNGGTSWTTILKTDGLALTTSSAEWLSAFYDLSAYKAQSSVLIGFEYDDDGDQLIGAAVDNIKIFDPAAIDIALTDVTPYDGTPRAFGQKGSALTLGGTVMNMGASTITSFNVNVDDGVSAPVVHTISGVNIAPFTSYDFTTPNPYTLPSAMGYRTLTFTTQLTGDVNASNNNGATKVGAADFLPTKRTLMEEGTGTWCGWCPRGHVYMDSIHKTNPNDVTLVAVHNSSSDPMRNAAYDGWLTANFVGSFPGMAVDRTYETDPSNIFAAYDDRKDLFAFADITLTDVAASGFDYALKATVKPAIDLSGDYRLVLILTEDEVHGTTSGYNQTNYYTTSKANLPLKGAGLDWQAEPDPVPASKMYYEHVGRIIAPTPTGAASSLPTSMSANSSYDYTFNVSIPAGYHRENMHAIVALLRNSDGVALNSNEISVPLGLKDVTDAGINELSLFPNPASDKVFINFDLAASSEVSIRMIDAVGRVVNQVPAQSYNNGSNKVEINTSNLPSGVYTISIHTEQGTVTKHLNVIK